MVSCPFNQLAGWAAASLAGWAAASLAGWRAGLLAPPPPHPPPTSSSPAHCGCELYYRTSVARCGCAPVARLGCSVTSLPLPPPRMYRFTANVSANVDILLGPTAATTGQQAAEPAGYSRNSSALPRRRTERRVMYRSNIRNIHTLTSYLTSWRSDRLGIGPPIYGHAFVSANFASALLAWQRSYTELDGRTPRPQKLLI